VVVEWAFDRGGDLEGWFPNGHLADVVVTHGALSCRAVGADPILELRPLLDLQTSPWQVIELRLKADHDGVAEFFWSNTSQGRFGGFAQEKTTRFNVVGGGEWRTYRLMPFWHPEGKLARLRFDVYDGARFELDYLRLVELAVPPTAERSDFDFGRGAQGWREVALTGGRFLLSPPLRADADRSSFLSLRMATRAEAGTNGLSRRATLFYAADAQPGLHSLTFPLGTDGGERTYNLDMLDAPNWRGRIIALGLDAASGSDLLRDLRWVRLADTPQGPPQLSLKTLAIEEALPRVGRPVRLKAVVVNTGGAPASNVLATLDFAAASANAPRSLGIDRLDYDEESVLSWTLQSDAAGFKPAVVKLTAANAETVRAELGVRFTPAPKLPVARYVPEPAPVRGPHEVGVYYFPGWKSASQWQPIQGFPERRPVLGWYREGEPEIADWHIKWAVEHGITFFAYDWYWSQGSRQLEHALHDGYFKARYRHLLKFCLLWANHNAPRTSSRADCLAVTQYWIDNYFRRPEHLSVGGKPVMIIFSPQRLSEDLGADGVKPAFAAMRALCENAGLKGLFLIACVGDAGQARQAAAEAYDAVTAYTWPHLGMKGEGMYAPFATLLEGYQRQWTHLIDQSPIPLLPLPVCGGWDSRPWHGENNLVRYGRTPELFRQHLADAREVLEKRESRDTKGPGWVLVEAWNEWGEGAYIEPHQEFGFGYLDAIRATFTDAPRDHLDLAPGDVGLGPYDVVSQPPRTTWDFARDDEGWNNVMDLADMKVGGGYLTARTTGRDPAFFGPLMQAKATDYAAVIVRMKLEGGADQPFKDFAQLFWRTRRLPESEVTCERFEVVGDGAWHEYRIPVGRNNRWRGLITRLRLDPCNRERVQVTLDSIRAAN
jgi:hypothetical protein